MAEQLTFEELEKAETMPLNELRDLAIKEAENPPAPPKKEVEPEPEQIEVLDNSKEAPPEPEPEPEPEEQVFRKVIENEDGSTDVYEAATLEDLVDKIAEGKRNANKQIKTLISERRVEDTRTAQQKADDEYVVAERLKKEPKKTVEEIVSQVLEERTAREQRSQAVQSRFVNTHPEYLVSPENGTRLVAEFRRVNPDANEFTSEGLEKAYLNLKRDGLIALKKEADGATEANTKENPPTEETKVEAAQPRSPRSSTISTRSSARTPVKTEPTEDEAYSMPLDKLRDLANRQLAERNQA